MSGRMYVLFTTLGSASNGSEHANMITYKGAVGNSTLEKICLIDWFYVKQEDDTLMELIQPIIV